MEEKKTIFNYISHAFAIFGIVVVIFMVFSLIIGESTEGYSTLFILGDKGLTIATLFELLLLSVIITVIQVVFLTDKWIKNMAIVLRHVLFFIGVMIATIILALAFNWLPVNDIKSWIYFFICFIISCFISIAITRVKEHTENKKMQEALEKYNSANSK